MFAITRDLFIHAIKMSLRKSSANLGNRTEACFAKKIYFF